MGKRIVKNYPSLKSLERCDDILFRRNPLDVYLMFISAKDEEKLPVITERMSLSNRIDKPLLLIAIHHTNVLSPFVINRSWVRVPSLAPFFRGYLSR